MQSHGAPKLLSSDYSTRDPLESPFSVQENVARGEITLIRSCQKHEVEERHGGGVSSVAQG